jgi:hypothetical protein
MTAGTDLVEAVAAPLRAAGLRVAVTQADLVPPTLWVAAEGVNATGGTLAGPLEALFYVYWIPVRALGVGDTARTIDALLEATDALAGVAGEVVQWRSVQLVLDPTGPWLAYRAQLSVVASVVATTAEV